MPIFTQELNPTENYVYHYTSLEVAIEHILTTGKLRFSPFIQTNDPRESKEWMISASVPSNIEVSNLNFMELGENFNKKLKRDLKVLSMTVDERSCYRQFVADFSGRGFSHSRMWAQYANNHRGVCLVFDKDILHQTILTELNGLEQILSGYVDYSTDLYEFEAFRLEYEDIITRGLDPVLEDHLSRFFPTLLLKKSPDWRDEFEFRWITKSEKVYEYVSINNSIKAVILGADTPLVYESVFREFRDKYNIEVAQMYWRNGVPSPVPALP